MTDWSAATYLAFADERTRPVRDLVAAIPAAGQGEGLRAIDLGCGPGNSTEVLAARFPAAAITGLDSSPDMLSSARRRLPGLTFVQADIATWRPAMPYDVILSNATLHWLPDHADLFPRLIAALQTGGSLAIQMPDNLGEPAHQAMREVAAEGPWRDRLADAARARTGLGTPQWHYALLKPLCARVDVWRTTYHHPLSGVGAVADWFRSTGLRPFLDPLGPEEQQEFLVRYNLALARVMSPLPDGSVILPFPRLFLVATR